MIDASFGKYFPGTKKRVALNEDAQIDSIYEARENSASQIDYYLSRYSSEQALEIARADPSDSSTKMY